MKKQLFIVSLLVLGTITQINAQQGFGTITPDASAVIDITSTTQGLLMPRMTTVQRTAIATPATGLEVYDTTTKSHWYFDGTLWVENTSGGAADHSDDAWVNATGRIELATQSNGTTARLANTEFVALDNGDVGIGTVSPLGRLEINHIGTAGIIDMLVLNSPGNSGLGRGQRMLFRTPSSAGLSHEGGAIEVVGLGGGENTYMGFSTSSQASGFSEMMRITNTGNVGIGTDSPSLFGGYRTLEVLGNAATIRATNISGDQAMVQVDANGNVNYGTTFSGTPGANSGTASVNFYSNAAIRQTITADGDIGIGTTTPKAPLHLYEGTGTSSSVPAFFDDIIVETEDNAGISILGSSTDIVGISFGDPDNSMAGYLAYKHSVDQFVIAVDNVERLFILNNGNVGIGTNAPTERLEVDGNILASGTITPDYVFESYYNNGASVLNPAYKMLSLKEIEAFTKANNHLPGVASSKEVAERGGILVNRATEVNLEKIEELYLHTIEQQKQLEAKDKKISELESRLAKIEAALGMVGSEK